MAEPLAIDVAGAQAALDAAGGMPDTFTPPGQERDPITGQFAANQPAPAQTPDAAVPPATPEATTPPAAPADAPAAAEEIDFGSFTNIDVNALTPEMAQMQRSLQADYTRKMQEAAPWRKLGQELGLESPDDFRNAAQVYNQLQDPRNWPVLQAELTEYMRSYGMSPAQASEAAANQLAQLAPTDEEPQYGYSPAEVSPDIAPLMQVVQQLQNQVSQLTQQTTQEKQQQAQQAQWNAVAQRLTTEEASIRAANPHYTDDTVASIYNLMGPEGNLLAAQQRFEGLIGAEVSKYIASKAGAQEGAPVPVGGAGVIATPAAPGPLSVAAGHAAAMAHVAALDRAELGGA